MSVRSAQSVTALFSTRAFDTGDATDADSLPTGTLYVNGTSNAATVTVTNVTTGLYKFAVTMPTLAVGDVVDVRINATVDGVTDNAIVWRDTKDLALDSAYRPGIDWSNVGAPTTTVALTATTFGGMNAAGWATAFTVNTTKAFADAVVGSVVQVIADNAASGGGGGGGSLDLTQVVPTTNDPNTVGDCLNAARAQGFGDWVREGTELSMYAPGGVIVVHAFELNSAIAPSSRTSV